MILGSKSQTRLAALDVQQMWKSCLLPHSEIVLGEIHSHMTSAGGDRGYPRNKHCKRDIREVFGRQGYQICNASFHTSHMDNWLSCPTEPTDQRPSNYRRRVGRTSGRSFARSLAPSFCRQNPRPPFLPTMI